MPSGIPPRSRGTPRRPWTGSRPSGATPARGGFPAPSVLCLLAGLAAALGARRLVRDTEARLDRRRPAGLWSQIGIVTGRFLVQGAQLIAFLAAAYAVDAVVNRAVPADGSVVRYVVRSLGWTWFAVMAARFVLAPARPHLRLCAVDDRTAWFLTWRIGLIFGFSAFASGLLRWVGEFGWPLDGPLGFWLSVIFHGLMALTLWQARAGITGMVLGRGEHGPAWSRFARLWPTIAIVLVVLQWLVVELFAATGNLQSLSVTALNVSLALVLALPLAELAIPALVEAIWPGGPEQDQALRAAHKETQLGLVRCGRTLAVVVLVFVIARLWGLDLRDLASQGIGAQFAGALVEVFLIGIVAYGLWELLEIMADRQIAIERAALGLDGEGGEEQFEGEGGQGGTRLGTIMPLVRRIGQVIILALALLAVLGQIGVNITPLLAGAGIVGLAVGFGAQALVKDIISGVFFLIDDAFRKGEYIDIGTVKGTVESISIRSMQLRHHNGPLNTIPFGEIRHLTNFSRDWVMMKLPLRVTYDTDVEKLRKLIKKLGQDLLQDPELGPKFLLPLKSQGVIQMEDSAMIVRVKFMTRPGDQWLLRNKVFARIRELFEREGIRFAHREVTVRIADHEAGKPLSEAEKEAAAAAARSAVEQQEAAAAAPRDGR